MPIKQRIAATLMSLIVLLSAMSFHLDMHFCGDHLVSLTFADEAKGCVMAGMEAPHNMACEEMVGGADCCSEAKFFFDGQDQHQKVKSKVDRTTFASLPPVVLPYVLSLFRPSEKKAFQANDPPFLIRDLHSLYETYLI